MARADSVLDEVSNVSKILSTIRKEIDKVIKSSGPKEFGVHSFLPDDKKKLKVIHDDTLLQVYLPLPSASIGAKIDPEAYKALKQAQDTVAKKYKALFDKIKRMIPDLEDADFTIGNNSKASFFFMSNALVEHKNEAMGPDMSFKGMRGGRLRSIREPDGSRHELVIMNGGKEVNIVLDDASVKQLIKHMK